MTKTSPSDQLDKFKQAARELECDNDSDRFKERLRKVAKATPKGESADEKPRP
jgi:hypothetical protein